MRSCGGGTTGISEPPATSQFFSFQDPNTVPGYDDLYGIPARNYPFDWVARGTL
jgi:hypothetical protein